MKKKIKIIAIVAAALLLIAGGAGAYIYSVVNTGFGIDKTVYIYIGEDKDYDKLVADIRDSAKVENIGSFNSVASWMKYNHSTMKPGRYAVKPGMTVRSLIQQLRAGTQTSVRFTFNNIRTKEDFAKRVSEQLMMDEVSLLAALDNEQICGNYGFTKESVVAMFIPNTYELYWNISVDGFLKRMKREYDAFWTEERRAKAATIGLTPDEVSTLASIVEEECTYTDEYSTVAGLYLNRLKRGQLLQADPTVKFAVGDFSLRRVLNKHLETDSPYNTYKYAGLPPGPIRIPSIKGIDSVLNYKKSDYLYMCAKEDFSGRHNFAKTLVEHNKNAANYRKALNNQGIYR
ncbi:endolytic transglycosylase MltG [Dysgonomonas sp. 25]|uniref:endolytic transglycosylase MltG n=1 Tax=Dysgonomonas sp. 25 TaxID=2302933 RepID=UPI0013D1B0CF|nr:endolytic transglycosylase MltG [Dysgonomonas sp. 25]NDV70305.1 endolytic transglycosylase MltG [Dysgonomonas sp. 25]